MKIVAIYKLVVKRTDQRLDECRSKKKTQYVQLTCVKVRRTQMNAQEIYLFSPIVAATIVLKELL